MKVSVESGWFDARLVPDWFLERPDGCTRVGYRVGAYVVDDAIRNSGRTAANLVGTSVVETLHLTGIPTGATP